MNKTHRAQLDATFENLHQDAGAAYRRVYNDIQQQLKGSNSYGLSGEIAQMEAKNLNQEILRLTDTVKQTSISEMIACGCKQYLTQAGWTEIQQAAGLPHTELCKVQVDTLRPPVKTNPVSNANDMANSGKELKDLAQQYGDVEKILARVASLGVAAVVVSLFIPGWTLPVKVLCVAGAIVAVLSGGGAIYYDSKKNEAISKFEHVGKSAAPKAEDGKDSAQLDSLIKQITDSQYKRNLKLYDTWLADVKQALITECDKLSVM
ncbi:MAG: hypothetical protein NC311_20100 [Muribaculaceae bacterium]|nr:hypothetical protein [Muribaculaceae bacterium]